MNLLSPLSGATTGTAASGESPTSKQKAKLLLKMANAVEDSSARRRQRLQEGKNRIDADGVDQLIREMEYQMKQPSPTKRAQGRGQDATKVMPPATTFTLSFESENSDSRSTIDTAGMLLGGDQHHNNNRSVVQPQQVQLLYTAMIRYRENADLRYQLLELKHLDLSRSFLELESRYRHLESEREAWKQSCQALELAANQGSLDVSLNRLGGGGASTVSSGSSPGPPGPANSRFQKSTLPILQQELKMLSSQRNQLLQANLELRKQLKQMQIQMQTPKAGEDCMTATCRRCHPELFVGRQQYAQDAFTHIVEHFHSSTTSSFPATSEHNTNMINSSHHRNNNNRKLTSDLHANHSQSSRHLMMEEEEEEELQEEECKEQQEGYNSDTQSMVDDSDELNLNLEKEEDQHQAKMNFLGIHFGGGTSRPPAPAEPPTVSRSTLIGNQQKSIIWSPPTQSPANSRGYSPTPPRRKKYDKSRNSMMSPTMNSILPMQHQQQQHQQHAKKTTTHQNKQQQQHDIQVSPRRDGGGGSPTESPTHQAESTAAPAGNKASSSNPSNVGTTTSTTSTSSSKQQQPHSPKRQEMDRFGQLDEFGRARSYRVKRDNNGSGGNINNSGISKSPNSSSHSGTTVTTSNTTNASSTAKTMSRFRRKSTAAVPSSSQQTTTQSVAAANSTNRSRRAAQRHSVATTTPTTSTVVTGTVPTARHLEYHLPGNSNGGRPPQQQIHHQQQQQQQQQPTTSSSGGGGSRLMTVRHLEFSTPPGHSPASASAPAPQHQLPLPPHHHPSMDWMLGQGQGHGQGAGAPPQTQTQTQTPSRRPQQDGNGAMQGKSGRSPAATIQQQQQPRNSPSHARGSAKPMGNSSSRGRAQPMGNSSSRGRAQPMGNSSSRGGGQYRRRQGSQQQQRDKQVEEQKPQRARPQSYFERIKKTLQQEI